MWNTFNICQFMRRRRKESWIDDFLKMPYFLLATSFFHHSTQFRFIDCNKVPLLQPYFCASKQNFLILFPFLFNGLTSNYYYILLVCNTTLERGVSCMLAIPFLPNNIYESEGSFVLFWDTSTMPYTCYLAMRHLDLFDRLVKNVIRYPRRTTRDLNAFFSLFPDLVLFRLGWSFSREEDQRSPCQYQMFVFTQSFGALLQNGGRNYGLFGYGQ